MRIGQSVVTIKPAMQVLIGAVIFGIVGIIGAGRYALGPRQTKGWAIPTEWEFATSGGANASLTMLTRSSAIVSIPSHNGYSQIDADQGFEIKVLRTGGSPDSVHIRNTIDFAVDSTVPPPADILQFRFQAASPSSFPIIFAIRDSRIKNGNGILWSHLFTVNGDWKTYSASIPYASLGQGHSKFVEMAGHMGSETGSVRLRNIYLK